MLGRGAAAAALVALGGVVAASRPARAEPVYPALAPPALAAAQGPSSAPAKPAIDPADLPPSEPAADTRARRWYGWETLLVDSVGLGLMMTSGRAGSTVPFWGGVGVYAVGPPVVHAARGHADKAGVDLAVRVLAPFALALTGMAIDLATSPPCAPSAFLCFRGLNGFAEGGILGYGGAVALDAIVLAWDRAPARHADTTASRAFTWSPTVGVTQRGGGVGVGGAF
jgi:hypothetical protein